MRIYQQKNNTIIEGINDFNLEQTLECGQCFRFYKQNEIGRASCRERV